MIFQQKSGDTYFKNKDELEVMTAYRALDPTQKRIIKSLLENMQKK